MKNYTRLLNGILLFVSFFVSSALQAECNFPVSYSTTPAPPHCVGDTITITALPMAGTPPYTYQWLTGQTTESIPAVLTGTYNNSVTITDANGCTGSVFVHIKPVFYSVAILHSFSPICEGDSLELTASVGGGNQNISYLWSTGSTTENTFITVSGTYSLTLTDNISGCTLASSFFISVPTVPPPQPEIAGPSTLCPGQNATLSVNGGNYQTYLWMPGGQSTPTVNISGPGSYSVTVSNASGCTGTDVLDISSAQVMEPNLTGPANLCPGQNGTISITNSGNYNSFLWSNGQTTSSITVNQPGTYTVTVTEAGGCTSTGSYTVANSPDMPNVTVSSTPSSCGLSNGAVNITVTPAGSYTYFWSNGSTMEDLNDIPAGSYIVTVTSVSGCTGSATAAVSNNNIPINITGSSTPNTFCTGGNGSIDIAVSPAGSYTFIWSNGFTTEDLVNLQAGTYMVTVSAGGSCSASSIFNVGSDINPPVVTSSVTPATCGQNNGAINLNVGGAGAPFTFLWSNGSAAEDIQNLFPGPYFVTVTGSNGCAATASVNVPNNSNNLMLTAAPMSNTSCTAPNGAIDLTVTPSGSYFYSWSNGAATEDLTGVAPGSYAVTVSDGGGCTTSAVYTVGDNADAPAATTAITGNTCGQNNGAIDLTVTPPTGNSFLWTNGATTEDLANIPAGTYSVTVTGSNGCSMIQSATVPDDSFTPNLSGAASPNTSCAAANGSINISVLPTGNYAFLWSNGATPQNITGLTAGTYSVTVSAGGVCTAEGTFIVASNTASPVLSESITAAVCGLNNGAIDVSVTPSTGNGFFWTNGATTEDLANIPAGTYSVTITGSNGCTTTGTFDVPNHSTTFSLSAIPAPNTSCTAPDGEIDLTTTPTGAYTFLWSNGATTEDITGLVPGTYAVTVTEAGSCTASASYTVQDNSGAPVATLTASPESCGLFNGSIEVNVNPSTGNGFIWSNGATTEDLANIPAGTYSVTVTGQNGCSTVQSAAIADDTFTPDVSGAASPNTSCVAGNGSISTSVSPADSYTFTWSNGEMTQHLDSLAAGTYTVTVSAGGSCTSSATFTIADQTNAPVLTENITPAICGQNNGGIDLSVTPTSGNIYSWSNGATTEDLVSLASGTYSVTITSSSDGCTATGVFDVPAGSSNFSLSATTTANTSCSAANGAIDLTMTPSDAYTFIWSNGETVEDLNSIPSGIYTVTVSDGSSCTASASYSVSSNVPIITVSGTTTPVACFGGTGGQINLNVNGGTGPYAYLWSPVVQNPLDLPAGIYSVTATDASGCTGAASFSLQQPSSALSINCAATANVSAPGASDGAGSVTAGGGTGPYLLSWSPGGATNVVMNGGTFSLNNLYEGSYGVTVTDANGCPEVCDFTILGASTPPCLTAVGLMETNLLTACGSGCVSADYSTAGEFLESDDVMEFVLHQGSGPQILGEIARNDVPVFCFDAALMSYGTAYYISAVAGDDDGNGSVMLSDSCTHVSLGTPVVFYPVPQASILGENITCQNEQAQLTGASSLPGSAFSWVASGGGMIQGNLQAPTVTATAGGFYSLTVNVNGCADTVQVEVLDLRNQPSALIVSAPDNVLDCSVDQISLTGSYTGTSNGSVSWINGGSVISNGMSVMVNNPGMYEFIIVDTVTFCSDTAAMEIVQNQNYPPLFLDPPPVLTCKDTVAVLTGGSPVNGIQLNWSWVTAGDTIALGSGGSVQVNTPGIYLLTGTDLQNGCQNTLAQTVFSNTEGPAADAGQGQTLDCHQTPVTLNGSAFPDNVSFQWTANIPGVVIPNPASPEITVNEAGVYTLVVQRLDNFCADTASVEVLDYQSSPQAIVTVDPPTCYGDGDGSIFIETNPANAPFHFKLNGKSYGSNPSILFLDGGDYLLEVSDGNGCAWTTEVMLNEPAPLALDLGADLVVEYGETVTLTANVTVPPTAIEAVLWQPDSLFTCGQNICLEQEIAPTQQTEVKLTVIDTNGCKVQDKLMLYVRKDHQVYIPNAFSPNGDGANDVFVIYGNEEVEEIVEFQIFQRWGEFVFHYENFPPNDPLYGWDGTYAGKPLNPQVFVYWAKVKFTDGTERFFEGGITLVR